MVFISLALIKKWAEGKGFAPSPSAGKLSRGWELKYQSTQFQTRGDGADS